MAADGIKSAVPVPQVDYERCSNRKQKWQECTVCRDACPKNAITYNNKIAINQGLCNGCHLCLGVCPTQCIYQKDSFIKSNNAAEQEIMMISCRKRGAETVGFSVPCIAALPWEFYAYSSYREPISIMTGDCGQCQLGATEHIQAIHERLRLFFGDVGYEQRILKHVTAPAVEYSRREMFSIFSRKNKESTEVLMPEVSGDEEVAAVPIEHPSQYRKLLLNELDGEALHGWQTWEISQQCRGCMVCSLVCPNYAMHFVDKDGQRAVVHDVTNCTACGVCKLACPSKSIGELIPHYTSISSPFAVSLIQNDENNEKNA